MLRSLTTHSMFVQKRRYFKCGHCHVSQDEHGQDTFGMDAVLHWVYGTYVSPPDYARDLAQRSLGTIHLPSCFGSLQASASKRTVSFINLLKKVACVLACELLLALTVAVRSDCVGACLWVHVHELC